MVYLHRTVICDVRSYALERREARDRMQRYNLSDLPSLGSLDSRRIQCAHRPPQRRCARPRGAPGASSSGDSDDRDRQGPREESVVRLKNAPFWVIALASVFSSVSIPLANYSCIQSLLRSPGTFIRTRRWRCSGCTGWQTLMSPASRRA